MSSGWVRWSKSRCAISSILLAPITYFKLGACCYQYVIYDSNCSLACTCDSDDWTGPSDRCIIHFESVHCQLYASNDPKSRLVEVDDFIAKLWDIHLTVKKEGYVQV